MGTREGGQKVSLGLEAEHVTFCNSCTNIIFPPQLTLQSSVQKHRPVYKLKVLFEAPSGKKWEDKEIEGRFMQWFNKDGFLQHSALKNWLAGNIDVIGRADPQEKAVAEEVLQDDDLDPKEGVEQSGVSAIEGRSIVKGRRTKKRG